MIPLIQLRRPTFNSGGFKSHLPITIKFRKGFNKRAFDQHRRAIKNSGSRYGKLKTIKVPTLLIHGSDDPLIKVSHSKKLASLIHGSRLVIIKGMGHDFNKNFKNRINSIILPHVLHNS